MQRSRGNAAAVPFHAYSSARNSFSLNMGSVITGWSGAPVRLSARRTKCLPSCSIDAPSNKSVLYLDAPAEPAIVFPEHERQIEIRPLPRGLERHGGVCLPGAARVLEREHDLEQRMATRIALWPQLLDEPLERRLLMRERVKDRLAHPLKQGAPARLTSAIETQHERIDEAADEAFRLFPDHDPPPESQCRNRPGPSSAPIPRRTPSGEP